MIAKNDIVFLLNPVGPLAAVSSSHHQPPSTPPTYFHRPTDATLRAATSLTLLSSVCLSPMAEKRAAPMTAGTRAFKKRKLLPEVLTQSSSECDDDLAFDAEAVWSEAEGGGSLADDSDSTTTTTTPLVASTTKSRSRPCQVDDCTNMAVSRGCCVRHGGGSRCDVAGCANRAKLHRRCFQHGGYKSCQADGCDRKAKRYGFCWSHGGGRICYVGDCTKVSTQGGRCWAHGGGNRCKLDGCSRRAYQKYGYYCVDLAAHAQDDGRE